MAGKLSLLVGFGAGYVLGARSGRERYDQIADKAQQLWRDPRVQERTGQARQVVQEKTSRAGQMVKENVASASSSNGNHSAAARAGADGPDEGVTGTRGGKLS
jgi:SLT domain-containing protein